METLTRITSRCAALSLVPALLLLGACGNSGSDQAPGNITAGEARALDEAASMITSGRPAGPDTAPTQDTEGKSPTSATP